MPPRRGEPARLRASCPRPHGRRGEVRLGLGDRRLPHVSPTSRLHQAFSWGQGPLWLYVLGRCCHMLACAFAHTVPWQICPGCSGITPPTEALATRPSHACSYLFLAGTSGALTGPATRGSHGQSPEVQGGWRCLCRPPPLPSEVWDWPVLCAINHGPKSLFSEIMSLHAEP